jgi:hypothetical protein
MQQNWTKYYMTCMNKMTCGMNYLHRINGISINYFDKEEVNKEYCRLILDDPRHSLLLRAVIIFFRLIMVNNDASIW